MYANPQSLAVDVLGLLKPPQRLRVSETAATHMHVGGAGGYEGPWDPERTPYMAAPMDRLSDRSVEGVIFVGPAQSGKTEALVPGWMTHSILSDPCDMMVVHMGQHEARDFSIRRINRTIQRSPMLRQQVLGGNDDNVYDKKFRNGCLVNIGWPTISQLSGKPIRHIALTDFDRMPLNIEGEGDPFSLAKKRTQSFMSRGRILVESSPGHEILDPDWVPRGHGAPPAHGIFSLYNLGDRNRWYWQCPDCNTEFLAEWENISWRKDIDDPVHAAESAHALCPHCGSMIEAKHKQHLNATGHWYSEAMKFGDSFKSKLASYWLQGPAAAFQTWNSLVYNYIMALKDFESTGSQEKLKATVNTDQGRAYALMAQRGDGLDAITLKQRAESSSSGLIQREVPGDAHFVTTSVDVQKHRFVVQVQAWAPGRRTWIVDRFNLTHSDRIGEDGNRIKVSPFTHAEDWAVLDKLLADEYTVSGTDLKVKTRLVVCDSGGGGESKYNNSTINAYAYATRLKRLGRADRFALLKGASTKKSPRIAKGKPGDDRIKVPLWVINPNTIKDEVHEALSRNEVGDGYVYLPEWLQEWFFRELTAETRTPNGWVKRRKADNNEAFDLCVYNLVAWSLLGGDRIDWAKPPSWCARPLGQSTSPTDKPEGNKNFLKYLRERSQRLNGE